MRNLERQVGQLARQAERLTNVFPSDTISNPKKECKGIQLRSGKTLENDKEVNKKPAEDDKVNSKEKMAAEDKDQESSKKKEDEPQASKKGKQVMTELPQE
ncbi:hypothetical protein AHAS_Ahas19G0167600 [Arachis hypogaea]